MSIERSEVPAGAEAITAEWLHSILPDREMPDEAKVQVSRIGEGYGLASELFRVRLRDVRDADSVVVKLWELVPGGADMREIHFFRTFGDRISIRTPRCLYTAADEGQRRAVLVLEDIGSGEQGDVLTEIPPVRSAALARTLGRLHGDWWGRAELDAEEWLPVAPRVDRASAWFGERREIFLDRFGDRLDGPTRNLVGHPEPVHAYAVSRLQGAPRTLLHQDLHLDNVLFDPETDEPILLDWARVAKGPAVIDLAELVFSIAPTHEDELIGVYLESLRERGVGAVDEEELMVQLGAALLLLFLRSTFGVALWEPTTTRETRMIERSVVRSVEAVDRWLSRDPSAGPPERS